MSHRVIFSKFSKLKVNYYQVLGVQEDYPPEDLKTAYRKKALVTHPDKNGNTIEATKAFQTLIEAYTILSHERTRHLYDMWLDYLAEHEAEEFLDDEDQEAQYEGYSDFCATTEAEWSREYQNAFNEFEQKKERWEAEFEERKRESETRPMQTQEDILEELDDDWPGLQKHTRDYAAQIVETLNKLFHTHKQHTLNKLLNKIARVNQGKQEEFSLERLTQLHFAAQYSALPVFAKYGKIFLCSTRSCPPRDYGDVKEHNESRRHAKAKTEAQQAPKPRLLLATKTVQELKAEREALEISAAKSYSKARAACQNLEEVKLALDARQQKQESMGWRGEQAFVKGTRYYKKYGLGHLLEADGAKDLWKQAQNCRHLHRGGLIGSEKCKCLEEQSSLQWLRSGKAGPENARLPLEKSAERRKGKYHGSYSKSLEKGGE